MDNAWSPLSHHNLRTALAFLDPLLGLPKSSIRWDVVFVSRGWAWKPLTQVLGEPSRGLHFTYRKTSCLLSHPPRSSSCQFLLTPFYAWRSTHHAHHKATMSLERDENYIPKTRSDYNLPSESLAHLSDYHEIFEETPFYTLLRMAIMQTVGWHYYLLANAMGNPSYPRGTNVSVIPQNSLCTQRAPSLALQSFISPLQAPRAQQDHYFQHRPWGDGKCPHPLGTELWLLGRIPTLCHPLPCQCSESRRLQCILMLCEQLTNHWIVMLTYLHHSDPTIPMYRGKEWSFLRGAISTVDRPLLGWAGRFFLHNVSHDHVSNHPRRR